MPGRRPSCDPDEPAPRLPDVARSALLAWYDAGGRTLAFRASRDPYAILVSEVMAQQTQIARVVPAWGAFIERFPTAVALAAAAPADVLRAWRGMGYDRRALNLQRAARAIVADHGGRVPASVAALERLPGIGPYTARAVASIAFGLPVGAVDTNVRRVLGRALGIAAVDAGSKPVPGAARTTQAAADGSVDPGRPADWTHALMDLGATVCRPRTPRCDLCPIATWCRSASRVAASPAARVSPRTRRHVPFTATTRWLRGRILDRLRAVDGAAWTSIDGPIGSHDPTAVAAALAALARDGLVELDASGSGRARLATG
jgi:A/G-specific adenine glycosylase